jgi:hypothetical protein
MERNACKFQVFIFLRKKKCLIYLLSLETPFNSNKYTKLNEQFQELKNLSFLIFYMKVLDGETHIDFDNRLL